MDKNGNILSAQDYYPYGGILRSYSTGGNTINDRYKFTQKERDTETGYDYFGARYYDSDLGRWMTPDPMANKYPGWSPYNYCLGNPLGMVDADGNDPELIAGAVAAAAVATGVVITATYMVTKDYLEHPSSANLPSQSKVIGTAVGLGIQIYNDFSNWLSSGETTHLEFPMTEGEGINKTTIAPADATHIPTTFNSSNKQNAKQIAKILGIPIAKAHDKIKEIKRLLPGNPDIKIDKDGNIKYIPTTGKDKGKEFNSGEKIEQYK